MIGCRRTAGANQNAATTYRSDNSVATILQVVDPESICAQEATIFPISGSIGSATP